MLNRLATSNSSSMNNQLISELDALLEDQKPGSAETEAIVDSSTSTCVVTVRSLGSLELA